MLARARVEWRGDKVEYVEVAPAWRGLGLGRALVEMTAARRAVAGSVEGARLFERMGWVEVGVEWRRPA